MMLHDFITRHHDAIVARTRDHALRRSWPAAAIPGVERGAHPFLAQVAETLRLKAMATPASDAAIGSAATRRGAELSAAGFTVSQVVYDYGDICQAITEIAFEHGASITVDEFRTLNWCLDTAIADAVTEYARLLEQRRSSEEVERLGRAAHEHRDLLQGALLAFHMLRRGLVPINGSTGAVLGRGLTSMLAHVDRELSEVRLGAGRQAHDAINVATLVEEIAATGVLHAELRGVRFTVVPVEPELGLEGDPQLIASAVMNLLHNAFKYTRPGGGVILRAYADGPRLLVEVEDECGGIPESKGDLFQAFGSRRGADRSGLGLGLSLARRAVRAHGGDINVRNLPGRGCVFTIDLPLAVGEETTPRPSEDVGRATHTGVVAGARSAAC